MFANLASGTSATEDRYENKNNALITLVMLRIILGTNLGFLSLSQDSLAPLPPPVDLYPSLFGFLDTAVTIATAIIN